MSDEHITYSTETNQKLCMIYFIHIKTNII